MKHHPTRPGLSSPGAHPPFSVVRRLGLYVGATLGLLQAGVGYGQASPQPAAAATTAGAPAQASSSPGDTAVAAGTGAAEGAAAPASSATGEEEMGFDEVLEPPPPPAANLQHWYDIVHLSGRFDVNYELDNPATRNQATEEAPVQDHGKLKNYHHFIFLKATPTEKVTLEAELVDQSFYELKYKLTPTTEFHAGKIPVPFGSSPFHHYYGAKQGNPFLGLLVPNVWAEYGGALSYQLIRTGAAVLDADTYIIRGFDGTEGMVLGLNIGGSDTHFAVGQRFKLGLGTKAAVWASGQYNRWGLEDEGRIFLWGLDARLDYGLIPLPFLKDFAVKAAFARADIKDALLQPDLDTGGWYWRSGDFLEVSYGGLRPYGILRLRYGTVIDYNLEVTQKDVHNWALGAMIPFNQNLSLLAEYQWNMEEVDEIDNDLLRVQLALEF